LIDLHTHTTASDGRLAPAELVARASGAGVTILAVTDHDTVASSDAAAAASAAAGIALVPGIEITAVYDGVDIHVLGYFIDHRSPALLTFLADARRQRLDRAREIIQQLARRGVPLAAGPILQPALDNESASIGRPWIARALVAAGHVPTTNDAFDRWLSPGRPAFVPRIGPSPEMAIARIHDAGGVAALAHPAVTNVADDAWIDDVARSGLDAIEAYHSKHDAAAVAHYLAVAAHLGLAVSGGSDYHGNDEPGTDATRNVFHGPAAPGAVSLPREAYDGLAARRPTMRASASGADTSS
jgi:predicted metal-dependent phosphoesterase TrpH